MRTASEGKGGPVKPDASSRHDSSAAQSAATEPLPILPPEILAQIGTFLPSGTRSLLQFARSCRCLYELMVPHLHRVFLPNPDSMCSEKLERVTKLWERKRRFEHVRHLCLAKLNTWRSSGLDVDLEVILGACSRATTAKIALKEMNRLYQLAAAKLPHLYRLDPHMTTDDWDRGGPDLRFNLPLLGELTLRGYISERLIIGFGPESCPKLEIAHIDLPDDDEWERPRVPTFLIPKIKSWKSAADDEALGELLEDDSFAPVRLVLEDHDDLGDEHYFPRVDRDMWSAILTLPSLRSLEVACLGVGLLTDFEPGVNLRLLAIRELHLFPLAVCDAPEVYRAFFSRSLTIRVGRVYMEDFDDGNYDPPTAEEVSELLDLVALLGFRGVKFEDWAAEAVDQLKGIAEDLREL
ncbi:hypothetical protein DFJ74DRAFT_714394 [Hyaloraphidium curvatum]|nr:hypothetical protein DFJ74DRAFT_714394 [Hyaloraphidium curvatum]